jgi:hypothetical protein
VLNFPFLDVVAFLAVDLAVRYQSKLHCRLDEVGFGVVAEEAD